jgi:predicted nuclease of restriction endonuclease-like (RecB) superfamily
MMQFSIEFPDFEIVVTLSRQLSWSHFLVLLPIKNRQAKQYYVNLTTSELWSVRELRHQIERKAFERNEIANVELSQEHLFIQLISSNIAYRNIE